MTSCSRLVLAAATAVLTSPISAQLAAPTADPDALLASACAKMADLPGVAFRTIEFQDQAMMRKFAGRMPAGMDDETEITGTWCNRVTQASINFEEDEVILHSGRMLARADGDWKLRRNALAGGAPAPFVLDPNLLFEILENLPAEELEIRCNDIGKHRGTDVAVLGVTFEGDQAIELSLAGISPGSSSGMGGGIMRRFGGAMPPDETTIDMAFYIDPESKLVHRVRIKTYKKSAMMGQIVIQGAGMDDDEPEEEVEAVAEFDDDGKRIYKKGLPVRELGDSISLIDFDVTFTDHGKTFSPDLDEAQRALLRL